MEDLIQIIVLAAFFLISLIVSGVKKLNDWINRKRMEADPRRWAARRSADSSSPAPDAQSGREAAPAPAAPQESKPVVLTAESILEQLEAVLPPEVAQARREARERARRAAQAQRGGEPAPPTPVKPAPSIEAPHPAPAPSPAAPAAPAAPPARAYKSSSRPAEHPAPPLAETPRLEPRKELKRRKKIEVAPAPASPQAPPAAGAPVAARPAIRPSRRTLSPARARVGLKSKDDLRRAIVLYEILGPPKSERMD